jgi:hypothetical protein
VRRAYVVQVLDVHSSSHHVGRNEHGRLVLADFLEGTLTQRLWKIPKVTTGLNVQSRGAKVNESLTN